MIYNHVNDNSTLAIAGSPLAGVGLTGVAIGTLGNLGRQYLVSKGLDRLT